MAESGEASKVGKKLSSREKNRNKNRDERSIVPPASVVTVGVLLAGIVAHGFPDDQSSFFGMDAAASENNTRVLTPIDKFEDSSENSNETARLVSEDFNLIYSGLTSKEVDEALARVEQIKVQVGHMFDEEHIQMVKNIDSLINASAQAAGMPVGLLRGLVITESLGDPKAESGVGAKGLTQVMEHIAPELGLKTRERDGVEERYIPEKILPATARELTKEYERFGNWGFALWSWHAGDPQIYSLIRQYAHLEFGQDLPDIAQDDYQSALEVSSMYKTFISQHLQNPYRLFQNQTIAQELERQNWDSTKEYLPRIIGFNEIYLESAN